MRLIIYEEDETTVTAGLSLSDFSEAQIKKLSKKLEAAGLTYGSDFHVTDKKVLYLSDPHEYAYEAMEVLDTYNLLEDFKEDS